MPTRQGSWIHEDVIIEYHSHQAETQYGCCKVSQYIQSVFVRTWNWKDNKWHFVRQTFTTLKRKQSSSGWRASEGQICVWSRQQYWFQSRVAVVWPISQLWEWANGGAWVWELCCLLKRRVPVPYRQIRLFEQVEWVRRPLGSKWLPVDYGLQASYIQLGGFLQAEGSRAIRNRADILQHQGLPWSLEVSITLHQRFARS